MFFLTGYTDKNLGGSNAGSYDAWVAKYDTDGDKVGLNSLEPPTRIYGVGQ